MSDQNNSITPFQSNYDMMKVISENGQTLEDIKMLTSSKVTDQLKVFLIAQARNELSRVLKLTQFLDKLEDQFIHKVDNAIIDDSLTLKQYGDIISIITNLLSRSNEIISKVLNDDSLTTILNTTVYTNDAVQTTSVVSHLKDSQSRERVRVVIQQVLNNTANYSPSNEYIDVTPQENEEENLKDET